MERGIEHTCLTEEERLDLHQVIAMMRQDIEGDRACQHLQGFAIEREA